MAKKKAVKKTVAKTKVAKKERLKENSGSLSNKLGQLLDAEISPNLNPLGDIAKAIEAVLQHRVHIIFRPMPGRLFKDEPSALSMWQPLRVKLIGRTREVTFYECFLYYPGRHSDQSQVLFSVAHELGHIILHYDKIVTTGKVRQYVSLPLKEKEGKNADASLFVLDFNAREEREADAFAQAITKKPSVLGRPSTSFSLPKGLRKHKKSSAVSIAPIQYLRGAEEVGTFPNVKLVELIRLASRTQAIIKKYGERRVEKVFEAQLALIIQSLGFYIVSTRTGYRTVDLICISDFPAQATSFLIEAKTSKAPYALPTKDERALCDYIEDVKRHIAPLPAIRFVLIIGNKPSKTLKDKLLALQAKLGVPVRFCSARLLVALRRKMPGPISADEFSKAVFSESVVMTEDFVEKIALAYSQKHEALVNLVNVLVG